MIVFSICEKLVDMEDKKSAKKEWKTRSLFCCLWWDKEIEEMKKIVYDFNIS